MNQYRIFVRSTRFLSAAAMCALLGFGLSGCASHPPMKSMAPGLTTDHGFPGVSVSGGSSQWPSENPPKTESDHRIYTETSPLPPSPKQAPKALPVPLPKKSSRPSQKTVYFSFNSARLSYWDKIVLDKLASELKSTHYRCLMIYGSTDPLGSEAYNKKLGLWRSLSVKRYLVSRGLPARHLRAISWGDKKSRLFSSCRRKSALCHSQSRSVRIVVRLAN